MLNLEPNILYEGEVADISYGNIPRQRLLEILASGRHSCELLEAEIAAIFGIAQGTQGAGPDLIMADGKTIQVKSFQSSRLERYLRGPRRGQLKSTVASIWTTKSGFWDRKKSLTDEDLREARAYIKAYDYFLYLDISKMLECRYAFVMLPSGVVEEHLEENFYISESAILSQVRGFRKLS